MFELQQYFDIFNMYLITVCFISVLAVVHCKIPEYITLCSKSDPELSKCVFDNVNTMIKHLAVDGEPSFKMSSIKTLLVPILAIHASRELAVTLTNLNVVGLADVKIHNFSMTDTELYFKAFLPKLAFVGTYDFNGKLLILVLKSVGPMNITQIGVDFDYRAKLFTEERHGKKYYYVSSEPDDTRTIITHIQRNSFMLGNLFPSDPRISDEMNIFLNDNWREVYNEVQIAMENCYSWFLLNPVINGILRHLPIDSLYLE